MPAPRREVIRPDHDPVIVTLDKGPQGIQREGQHGIDYQYICNGGRSIMWLPKSGRDALLACGVQAGEAVELSKTRIGYYAARVSDAAEPPTRPAAVRQMPSPPRQAPPAAPRQIAPPAAAAAPAEDNRPKGFARYLAHALYSIKEAQAIAREMGLELDTPSWEDVRAIAATLYIQHSKEGSR